MPCLPRFPVSLFTGSFSDELHHELYRISLWNPPSYLTRLFETSLDAMSESTSHCETAMQRVWLNRAARICTGCGVECYRAQMSACAVHAEACMSRASGSKVTTLARGMLSFMSKKSSAAEREKARGERDIRVR